MEEVAGVKRWTPALGWGLCAVALGGEAVGAFVQDAIGHGNEQGLVEHIALMVGFSSFPVVGAVIASRQPSNAIGWIFLLVGLGVGLLLPATEYAYLGLVKEPGEWPGVTIAAWFEGWLWYPGLMAIPTLGLLLFPNGRPPSPRWNWVKWSSIAVIACFTGGAMFQSVLAGGGNNEGEQYSIDNPLGFLPFEDAEQALSPIFLVLFPLMLLSVASLIVRYRRAGAEQRQQLKLLMVAAVTFALAVILGDLFGLPGIIFSLTLWMIPAAVGVAILKYRLYDVDLVINRTLVYGALTAILILFYLGIVFVLQQLMSGVTQDSDLAVAASTLAVAAVFRPLRSKVQGFIDRRFYRRKYNAQLTLENFSSRLRDDVDLQHLAHDLADVVRETMQPTQVSVWLRNVRP